MNKPNHFLTTPHKRKIITQSENLQLVLPQLL